MIKFILSLLILSMINGVLISNEIKNPDKPVKGLWDFKLEKIWSVEFAGNEPLADVNKIKCDNKDNIYTYDKKHEKLFVFNSQGKYLYNIGKKGEGPGEYNYISNFYIFKKYIIIADHEKLHYFLNNGKYIKTIKVPKLYNKLPAFFISKNEFLYIPNGTNNINLYDIPINKVKTIYGDKKNKGYKKIIESGNNVTITLVSEDKPKLIMGRQTDANIIFLGKNDIYKINSLDFNGNENFCFSIFNRTRKLITQKIKEKKADKMMKDFKGLSQDPKMIKKWLIKKMPDYFTFFKNIYIDKKGLVLVYVENFNKLNCQEFDVFSPDGKYIYKSRIKFPKDTIIKGNGVVFNKNSIIVFLEDSEGNSKLIKYKIKLPLI